MEMHVARKWVGNTSTIGELSINAVFECFTLEDMEREVKIKSVTAIPCGRYQVIVDMSHHFGYPLPRLLNVPGFEGVRIHRGNTDKDTDGCLLVGVTRGNDIISRSAEAFNKLFPKIIAGLQDGGKVWLTIEDAHV